MLWCVVLRCFVLTARFFLQPTPWEAWAGDWVATTPLRRRRPPPATRLTSLITTVSSEPAPPGLIDLLPPFLPSLFLPSSLLFHSVRQSLSLSPYSFIPSHTLHPTIAPSFLTLLPSFIHSVSRSVTLSFSHSFCSSWHITNIYYIYLFVFLYECIFI